MENWNLKVNIYMINILEKNKIKMERYYLKDNITVQKKDGMEKELNMIGEEK